MTNTKPHFHSLFCLIITVFLLYPSYCSATESLLREQTFMEEYFSWALPKKEVEGARPIDTLQAPFADQNISLNKSELEQLYDRAQRKDAENYISNLTLPHRSHTEIDEWILEVIGASLNFKLADMKTFGQTITPYYSQKGLDEFKNFLIDINVMGIMKTHKKKLSSYISDQPALEREESVNGVYTWVFEVPTFISYIDDSTPPKNIDPIIKKYNIYLEIMRTPNTNIYKEDLYINTWSAKKLKTKHTERKTHG